MVVNTRIFFLLCPDELVSLASSHSELINSEIWIL
jgi:hypothetical protein